MKMTFFAVIIFISSQLFANEKNNFEISRTFSLHIPLNVSSHIELPSLNSKLYRVKENLKTDTEYQFLVVHTLPPTYANKFSVERYWKQSREQTKSYDKNENDKGCKKYSSRAYECTRDVEQNNKYISEKLVWNTNNDLVLLRLSANRSLLESRKILDKIKIIPNSRLPARVSK